MVARLEIPYYCPECRYLVGHQVVGGGSLVQLECACMGQKPLSWEVLESGGVPFTYEPVAPTYPTRVLLMGEPRSLTPL